MNQSLVDPLADLRPVHLPPAVSWWPPAPGWWLSALLLTILLSLCISLYRRRAPRRAALAGLRRLERENLETAEIVANLSVLLKSYALLCFPSSNVAGLYGEAWLRFLDEHGGKGRFSNGPGRILLDGPYQRRVDIDLRPLFCLVRSWIKGCRRKKR
jgi:hypothetical protein